MSLPKVYERHGDTGSSEHQIWRLMRQRCHNPSYALYPNYGGRGIVMCDRWLNSYANFLNDMGRRPTVKHSIDRVDNDGNYEPDNCRWATHQQQSRNKGLQKRNKSGYTGVSFEPHINKWRAKLNVTIDGKRKYVSKVANNLEDAINLRKEFERKYDV